MPLYAPFILMAWTAPLFASHFSTTLSPFTWLVDLANWRAAKLSIAKHVAEPWLLFLRLWHKLLLGWHSTITKLIPSHTLATLLSVVAKVIQRTTPTPPPPPSGAEPHFFQRQLAAELKARRRAIRKDIAAQGAQ